MYSRFSDADKVPGGQALRPFISLRESSLIAAQQQIESCWKAKVCRHVIVNRRGLRLSALELNPEGCQTLVIIPGRAEVEHKYAELLYELQGLKVRVLVLFVRGQGSSTPAFPRRRCTHILSFAEYREDIVCLLQALKVKSGFALMAFSMGSLIALSSYRHHCIQPKCMALLAPFIYPCTKMSDTVLKLLAFTLGHLPYLRTLYTPHGGAYRRIAFADNYHSHSKIRYKLYHDYYAAHPDLAPAGPTFAFAAAALQAQRELNAAQFNLQVPVLMILSGADQVVSSAHAQAWANQHAHDQVPPEVLSLPDAYHDLLNEADAYRQIALNQALDFCLGLKHERN